MKLYTLCLLVPVLVGAIFILLPLRKSNADIDNNNNSGDSLVDQFSGERVRFWTYVLVYQGYYALVNSFMFIWFYQSALPGKGANKVITYAMVPCSVICVWISFAIQYAVDAAAIQQPFIHTIGPFVIAVPQAIRFLTRAYQLHKLEKRVFGFGGGDRTKWKSKLVGSKRFSTSSLSERLLNNNNDDGDEETNSNNINDSSTADTEQSNFDYFVVADDDDDNDNDNDNDGDDENNDNPNGKLERDDNRDVKINHNHNFIKINDDDDDGNNSNNNNNNKNNNNDNLSSHKEATFVNSAAFKQYVSANLVIGAILASFFFCQFATVQFRKLTASPAMQIIIFLLFGSVIFCIKAFMQAVVTRMDRRALPLSKEERASRPNLVSVVDAIQQWFYFLFYRTLFSSIEEGGVFALMMLVHVLFELCMYPLRMTRTFWEPWTRWRMKVGNARFWRRTTILSLQQFRERMCLEYVSRSVSFFSSLVTFLFLSVFWRYSTYNSTYYDPFDPAYGKFIQSLKYTAIAFGVEVACFAIVVVSARRGINFPFFGPWAKLMTTKQLALLVFLASASHITTDVCISHFNNDLIKI